MERQGRGPMAPPALGGGLVFTAGIDSPVATAARSQHQTAALLYDKLQAEKSKNALVEQRAEQVTQNAHKVVAQAAVEKHKLESELRQVKDRLRQVNGELDERRAPPKAVLDRVHALEATAYVSKQRLAGVEPETDAHAICTEQASFDDAMARRARHCAMTGEPEQVRHIHLNPEARASQAALGARLGSILWQQGLAPSEATAASRRFEPQGYSERVESFMDAVCEDIKAGLAQSTKDYVAAAASGSVANRV